MLVFLTLGLKLFSYQRLQVAGNREGTMPRGWHTSSKRRYQTSQTEIHLAPSFSLTRKAKRAQKPMATASLQRVQDRDHFRPTDLEML